MKFTLLHIMTLLHFMKFCAIIHIEVIAMPTAKTRAVRKYNAKSYDRIEVKVAKGQKEVIAAFAKAQGMSMNGFITQAIKRAMNLESE